ncbi:MAG: TMEM143 family protein [Nitriliruptor sp.]
MNDEGTDTPAGRFIPVRQRDLVDRLAADGALDDEDQRRFLPLVDLLDATFHFEFRSRLEALKDAYAPFRQDPDTRTIRSRDPEELAEARRELVRGLEELLEDANFERITLDEIHQAFEEESLLSVRVEVDFDDLDEVLVFRRGVNVREQQVKSWGGLRERTVTFTNYEKVLLFVTFKDDAHFGHREVDVDALPFDPGSTVIKLFQDVPRADIEMLFPNTEVKMRRIDKLLIGIPAVISGIIVAATRLAATVGLILLLLGFWLGFRDEPVELDQSTLLALGAGLGTLGSYLIRQFTKYKARQMEFMKTLADNLYFRNLDNDAGVFFNLIDSAEEEEVKEALLGWYFLRAAGGPCSRQQLDAAVEAWFAAQLDIRFDFEVCDGVEKLRRLGLVEGDDEALSAVPADEALRRLDASWDRFFDHSPGTSA